MLETADRIFEESGYRFRFPSALWAVKADVVNYARLSLVDFVVETDSVFYFIEVKNPDNPKASPKNRRDFLSKLQAETFPAEITKKFTDTLLAQLAMGRSFPKPVQYLFILEFGAFSSYERQILFDRVNNRLPAGLKDSVFVNVSSVKSFRLLTIAEFQRQFRDFCVESI